MRRWSETAERVAATSRTSEKVAILAAYLRTLTPAELPLAVTYLSGRPFPERDPRTTGLGWAAIAAAAEADADAEDGALGRAYDRSSDLGQAVHDVLAASGRRPSGELPALTDVDAALSEIATTRGAAEKTRIFRTLLWRCDPLTAKYVVKTLSGEMRIGLREGHLETAIAAAFGRDVEAVKWAGMLTGDLGQSAELARDDRLDAAELTLFRPLKSMLASPAADAAEVLMRLGSPVWVEDKYDGIRAQLHRRDGEARLYSRDLHDVSGQFPEVVAAAVQLSWDGLLDGELLAWKGGTALPFQQLQARLGRKKPPAALIAEVPCIFVAFDALALGPGDGAPVEPLLRLPLRERRARLDALGLARTPGFGVSNLLTAADGAVLERHFAAARQRGNEGLMVKDPESGYSPGRRGYGWLKLKRPLATLDCVVVGVEVGHGKRHGVLSDYTFAVLDDRADATKPLATIGKAYSGLTDAELAEMTRWFEAHTLERFGRYRVVEPTVVVEVAFDVIMRSSRHGSGFALRFPRIVRLRPDKPPSEIDRLATVERMHEQLQAGVSYRLEAGAG
ncbi:MAG: ligase I, ATP-dependent (dnl1), DNA ligase (ATP) protein [Chloroflexi bacterium CSP1-4]|nr:MAG: ligase I, ATP-dependent (dnl1), DNA ligase (ATP) protein [Chloroflexi bacterium CSP1-4]